MADPAEWNVERPRSGLARLLVPRGEAPPAATAFIAGGLGVAAFVASLVMHWQKITVGASGPGTSQPPFTTVLSAGLGTVDDLSLVYILGCVGLLGIAGMVITRPEAALRVRLGVAGVAIGLIGVLIAVAIRLPETLFNLQGLLGGLSDQNFTALMARTKVSYEPGMFCAFAAVVLVTGAVWLAAVPAARAAGKPGAVGYQQPVRDMEPYATTEAEPPESWRRPHVVGSVDGLMVSASEPLDLSVGPDAWRR